MRNCSICGHQNPEIVQSCIKCSAALTPTCPGCRQPVSVGDKFCRQCGVRLPETERSVAPAPRQKLSLRALMPTSLADKIRAAAVEIVGERREVSVLFVDVVNFSATARALDSEELYLLTDEAMRLLTAVVYKYEGTIDKYTGDGLMALFGAPIAHENDPERAVRAALEMQSVLQPLCKRVQQQHGLDFQARIGVNTGLVIAGRVGSDLHMEYTVIGDTVNLANRLQSAAEPGTVLVSFTTYQHTRPYFKYEAVEPLQVKGKSDPIKIFRPVVLRAKPEPVRGLPGLRVPMIGREKALARLRDTLADVCRLRHSRIAVITGEAGVGKSRLVAEFLDSVVQREIRSYRGGCLTYARARPFWLLADLLRDIMHISETDPAELQCEGARTYLDGLQLNNDDVFPYLTHMLGLEQTDPRIEARLRHLESVALQKLIHAALRQVFLAEARMAPTVLIFEDLHWIDPASREFLEHLIQTIDDVPLMLVLIARDAERDTVIRPLISAAEGRQDRPTDIQLGPLSTSEGQLLVDQLFQQTTGEAQILKRRIAERAEGNPFFAEEIVRMLMDQGGLDQKNGVWEMTPDANELLGKVPGTLRGLILARFDRLPPNLRRTLQKAAVLGSPFPVSLLQGLDGADAAIITAQISALEERHFLMPLQSGTHDSYAFCHALIQEIVYSTLLKRDRQQLHEQAAQAIEQSAVWLPDERTEGLAYHYAQSPNPLKAIPHLVAAAEKAARSSANETAVQHYRRALVLMKDLPDCDQEQQVRVQVGLGQALKFVGEYAQARRILDEVLQHLLHLSLAVESTTLLPVLIDSLRELADILVREGVPDQAIIHLQAGLDALGKEGNQAYPALWRSLVDRMAWVRFRQGRLEDAFRLASSATLGLDVEQEYDPMTLANLYNTLGGVLWQQGDLVEAIYYVERSLDLYQSLGYLWGMANSCTNLGVLHYALGNWPRAAGRMEQAENLQEQIGDLQNRAITLNNLGTLRQSLGEHEEARQHLETSLRIRLRLGDTWGIGQSHLSLAHLAVVQERFANAEAHVEAALAVTENLGAYEIEGRWILALSQANVDLQKGIETAEQALQMAREAKLAEVEADCRRVLGILRARTGDYLEAEVLLCEAVDLCLQLNAPYGRGRALLELGRLYQQLAHRDGPSRTDWQAKALKVLTEATEQFASLGAAYDLQMARTVIGQIKSQSAAEMDQSESRAGQAATPSPVSRQSLPAGQWHTAAVVWLNLNPPLDADLEDVFETIAMVMPALITIADEFQGQVIRRQNGLTLVFGAPTAYEDDVERAVRAAWQMLKYLNESDHPTRLPLSPSVAVTLGDVVAGHIRSGFHTEFMVTGPPVDVVQQIIESAPAGTVWVTDTVRLATERIFVYEPSPPDVTVDLADLTVWAFVSQRERPAPARGLPGLKAAFIGREEPLKAMTELARNLGQGIGGLVWIEGEPGIGKSRLMQEFVDSIANNGSLVWRGRCSPQKSGQAFSLFSDLLAQALNLQPTDTPDQIRGKIDQTLQGWPRDAQVTRPYLEMLLGVWPSGLHGERLAGLEPEQLRQQTFVSVRRLCKSLATERPLVILLDDLHWVDPMSAELLQFLLTMVASAATLFVCAQRRQGADLPNDRLVKVQSLIPTQTVRFCLGQLSPYESEMLLDDLLTRTALPTSVRTTILERSEGNPYFIEEFVRMLIEQGHLQHHQGQWEIDPNLTFKDIALPSSLETLIRSRIDALPPELKQVMEYGAVIGAPFEVSLLEAIAEQPNVKACLNRLEMRLLVHREAKASQWGFNHSIIETVVYNAMLKARRKALHLRVAQELEIRWSGAEAEHAEELAYHFNRAGKGTKALTYLVLAGERAAARYANEEAISYFEQAAEQLRMLPEASDHLRWRLAAGLGDVYRSMGKYADSTGALEVGLTLVETSGLPDELQASMYRRLGETAQKQGDLDVAYEHFTTAVTLLGEPVDQQGQTEAARIFTGLAWTHFLQGRFDQARDASEASLMHARRAGALTELAAAENLLGGVYYRQSNWELSSQHTRRAMILREQMGYTWGVAATLSNLGILAVSAGDWNKARSFFERSLVLRKEVGDVEGMTIVHNNLGMLARDQGDLEQAEFHFSESLEVARLFEIGYHVANSTIGLAHVMLLKGDIAAAQEAINESLVQAESIGANDMQAEIHRIQAEILLAQSAWDKARIAADEAVELAAETGHRSQESAAWRLVSEINLQTGDTRAAWEALRKAQRVAADASDELETGRLAALRGRIQLFEGNDAEAETDLRAAKMIFMRLGARLDLQHVDEALWKPVMV